MVKRSNLLSCSKSSEFKGSARRLGRFAVSEGDRQVEAYKPTSHQAVLAFLQKSRIIGLCNLLRQAEIRVERLSSDFGDVVAFLASDEARWITGQTIEVNGGLYLGPR
jgi:NAD(P)-dependent dehydrogenase (short-subunit alcohol dehydrogenase family)